MRYRYTGPQPVEDERGELVHPGDVREMDEAPPWGPWDPVPHATGELPGPEPAPPAEPQAAPAAEPEGM